jgi:hypothetical protein
MLNISQTSRWDQFELFLGNFFLQFAAISAIFLPILVDVFT